MTSVAICALMKSEARYIPEWVAYYDLLGFRMIVADNGGTDGTTEILSALNAAGVIDRIDLRWRTYRPQIPAYRALTRAAKHLGHDIIGFLDADEFFTKDHPITHLSPEGGAHHIAAMFKDLNANQLSFHWTCYGSQSDFSDQSRPVLERFEHHADTSEKWNLWTKSFVKTRNLMRTRDILGIGPNINSAHFSPVKRGWYVDGVPAKTYWKNPTVSHNSGRVLHYQNKSWEEFTQKFDRGSPMTKGGKNKNTPEYFKRHDYNSVRSKVHPDAIDQLNTRIDEIKAIIADHSDKTDDARFTAAQTKWMARGVSDQHFRKFKARLRGFLKR